jgi:tryptophan-rich sensory protein
MIRSKGVRAFQDADRFNRGRSPHSSDPWAPLLTLIGLVGLCLLVGAVGASITARSVGAWYLSLNAPPGTPPNWVFPVVWSALHITIGVAAWLVWRRVNDSPALRLWGWQLLANAAWTPAFFGAHSPRLALAVIIVMLLLIGLTIRAFRAIRPAAAYTLVPYLLWTCYAAYLNVGFVILNPT